MAVGLRVTDGTTTITLSDASTGILTRYQQSSAAPEVETVTDKAKILCLGGREAIRATVQSLNKLFRQANAYTKSRLGARVFVERDLGDGTYWRSQITDALPLVSPDVLDSGILVGKAEVDLVFTRLNYWEGAETQLALSNSNSDADAIILPDDSGFWQYGSGENISWAAKTLDAITIYSIDDAVAGKDNWVIVDGDDILGDLPAPIKIEIENTYDYAYGFDEVFMASNWRSEPANFQHVLECEDFDGGSEALVVGPGSPDYDLYSNGEYLTINPGAVEFYLYKTLDNTFLQAANSNYFRVMLKTTAVPDSDIWFYCAFGAESDGSPFIASTDYVLLSESNKLHDLGIIRIPPFSFSSTDTLKDMSLVLVYKRPAGTEALNIDYLQLYPLDSWRMLTTPLGAIVYEDKIIDNQYDGVLLNEYTTGTYLQTISRGGNILLEPGVDNRVYITPHGDTGTNYALKTAAVRIWYRPRRLTI